MSRTIHGHSHQAIERDSNRVALLMSPCSGILESVGDGRPACTFLATHKQAIPLSRGCSCYVAVSTASLCMRP